MLVVALAGSMLLSPPDEAIRWDAPAACPSGAEVARDAEALSGLAFGDASTLDVEGSVWPLDDGRWKLRLRVATATGAQTRELEADSCEELAGVAATLVAVAMEQPVRGPESEVELEPEPEPEPEPEAAPEPEPQPKWRAVLGPSVSLGFGALPGPAAVLALAVGAERDWLRLEAEADLWLPRDDRLPGETGGGALRLWSVTARGCGVPRSAMLRFPLCAGLQAGQMTGEGQGVSNPRSAALPWVAVEATAGLRVDVHANVAVRADVGAFVPLVRPEFTLDRLGSVHRAAPVGGLAGLGLELVFP